MANLRCSASNNQRVSLLLFSPGLAAHRSQSRQHWLFATSLKHQRRDQRGSHENAMWVCLRIYSASPTLIVFQCIIFPLIIATLKAYPMFWQTHVPRFPSQMMFLCNGMLLYREFIQKGMLWRADFYTVWKNVTKKHRWSLYRTLIVLVIFVLLLAIWLRSLRWIKERLCFILFFWCWYMLVYRLRIAKSIIVTLRNLNFQPYQLNAERGMDRCGSNFGLII